MGSGVVGWFVGFYPIETSITAGLCMANRGGSGDIAVLTAADRMDLMSFAQISSRLGGGLMLIIASIIFGVLF
ncbi:2-hydroxycarboxylate transporter family protein [Clostridium cochlearium]|uniref:2-hydroxycarboxylate transporter family protein n=1 Tax=Clostridium cochlearium TaxID=1494 RepID=A0ABY0QIM6_CLOCO|nr:2-hydroxycarboxylate transporter family protein [Clostridium cochlearium]SDK89290.1 2-hydroxycarboxylate transporter family protein [Clostridium cochlearium]